MVIISLNPSPIHAHKVRGLRVHPPKNLFTAKGRIDDDPRPIPNSMAKIKPKAIGIPIIIEKVYR